MEEKKIIRKEVFSRRKAVSDDWVAQKSTKIFEKIAELDLYKNCSSVYAYIDVNHEVMTRDFIRKAWADGKRVAVPRVQGPDLYFYWLDSFACLENGYFGIPEPKEGTPAADDENALLIVPGVAFDAQRHRIGYGKGFYDRYQAAHTKHATVAAAFEFQIMEAVPCEPTDVLPQYLVTEERVIVSSEF